MNLGIKSPTHGLWGDLSGDLCQNPQPLLLLLSGLNALIPAKPNSIVIPVVPVIHTHILFHLACPIRILPILQGPAYTSSFLEPSTTDH